MDYNKLLQTCVILMQYKKEVTLSSKTIQASVKLLFMDDNDLIKQMILHGLKYAIAFADKKNITNFHFYEDIIKTFMQNEHPSVYKINKSTIAYLTGVGDLINNQVQTDLI
jgi:hypothetical protein